MNTVETMRANTLSGKQFTQRAAGTFSPTIVNDTNHCGIDDNRGTFRYDVEIVYRGGTEILDSLGFLLDNLTFKNYFESISNVDYSCELLAMKACEHFEKCLDGRLHHVKSVSVKVYPFGEVFIQAVSEPQREKAP